MTQGDGCGRGVGGWSIQVKQDFSAITPSLCISLHRCLTINRPPISLSAHLLWPPAASHLDTSDPAGEKTGSLFYSSDDSQMEIENDSFFLLHPSLCYSGSFLVIEFKREWIHNLSIEEPTIPLPSPFPLFYCLLFPYLFLFLLLWGIMAHWCTLGDVQWRWNKPRSMHLRFRLK